MSQQSLKRNVIHEGYDKVMKKDQDIEFEDTLRHLKTLSGQTIQGQETKDIVEIISTSSQESLKTHK